MLDAAAAALPIDALSGAPEGLVLAPAGPADVRHVIRNLRQADREELTATFGLRAWPHPAISAFEASIEAAWAAGAVLDDTGLPCAIFGVVPAHPYPDCLRGVAFAAGTPAFGPRLALGLGEHVRARIVPALRAAGVRRVEARALGTHERAIKWMELLGATVECECPGHGVHGETFVQLAWT